MRERIVLPRDFFATPPGFDDLLFPAIMRFAAARHALGPRALMRRFPMGLKQAHTYIELLTACRVCMGQAGRRRHVRRVNPHAWRSLNNFS